MEFFYIITLTSPADGGLRSATLSGTIMARTGQTRRDLFNLIYEGILSKANMTGANVVFFDLALNELPTAVPAAAVPVGCGDGT